MFGCTTYTHVPKDERGKLDSKTKKCTLLGYGSVQKGYRVFGHVTQKVLYSRNVKFDEQEMGRPCIEEPAHRPLVLDFIEGSETDEEEGIKKRTAQVKTHLVPCIYTSGGEDTFYNWDVCRQHDSGWKGQDQDQQGQEKTIIEVRHQGSGKAELLSGNNQLSRIRRRRRPGWDSLLTQRNSNKDGDERLQASQDPCGSWQPSRESSRGGDGAGPVALSVHGI